MLVDQQRSARRSYVNGAAVGIEPLGRGDDATVLSRRERMIAARFADGMTYREIADLLCIAPGTVRTHTSPQFTASFASATRRCSLD